MLRSCIFASIALTSESEFIGSQGILESDTALASISEKSHIEPEDSPKGREENNKVEEAQDQLELIPEDKEFRAPKRKCTHSKAAKAWSTDHRYPNPKI